jgi:hypothetical protein
MLTLAPSSPAGLTTAIASVITALALIIGALPALIKVLRTTREVHTIVNQQRTDMQNYNRALIAALRSAGIEVPVDQSLQGGTE